MKPYFSKYLPVVGKIKAGDTVRDINTGFTAQLAEDADEYAELLNEHDYNKKVKLFLCSRDIQVGDIFNFIASDGRLLERKFFKDLSDHPDKINWFKIIGEISPDATWVKEGMEFNRDEFEMRWTNSSGQNSLTMSDVDNDITPPKLIVYIKNQDGKFY